MQNRCQFQSTRFSQIVDDPLSELEEIFGAETLPSKETEDAMRGRPRRISGYKRSSNIDATVSSSLVPAVTVATDIVRVLLSVLFSIQRTDD